MLEQALRIDPTLKGQGVGKTFMKLCRDFVLTINPEVSFKTHFNVGRVIVRVLYNDKFRLQKLKPSGINLCLDQTKLLELQLVSSLFTIINLKAMPI